MSMKTSTRLSSCETETVCVHYKPVCHFGRKNAIITGDILLQVFARMAKNKLWKDAYLVFNKKNCANLVAHKEQN